MTDDITTSARQLVRVTLNLEIRDGGKSGAMEKAVRFAAKLADLDDPDITVYGIKAENDDG